MHPDQGTAADTVAGIARAVPGVTRLHPGRYGEVGTYLPGRRVVAGLRGGAPEVSVAFEKSSRPPVGRPPADLFAPPAAGAAPSA